MPWGKLNILSAPTLSTFPLPSRCGAPSQILLRLVHVHQLAATSGQHCQAINLSFSEVSPALLHQQHGCENLRTGPPHLQSLPCVLACPDVPAWAIVQ